MSAQGGAAQGGNHPGPISRMPGYSRVGGPGGRVNVGPKATGADFGAETANDWYNLGMAGQKFFNMTMGLAIDNDHQRQAALASDISLEYDRAATKKLAELQTRQGWNAAEVDKEFERWDAEVRPQFYERAKGGYAGKLVKEHTDKVYSRGWGQMSQHQIEQGIQVQYQAIDARKQLNIEHVKEHPESFGEAWQWSDIATDNEGIAKGWTPEFTAFQRKKNAINVAQAAIDSMMLKPDAAQWIDSFTRSQDYRDLEKMIGPSAMNEMMGKTKAQSRADLKATQQSFIEADAAKFFKDMRTKGIPLDEAIDRYHDINVARGTAHLFDYGAARAAGINDRQIASYISKGDDEAKATFINETAETLIYVDQASEAELIQMLETTREPWKAQAIHKALNIRKGINTAVAESVDQGAVTAVEEVAALPNVATLRLDERPEAVDSYGRAVREGLVSRYQDELVVSGKMTRAEADKVTALPRQWEAAYAAHMSTYVAGNPVEHRRAQAELNAAARAKQQEQAKQTSDAMEAADVVRQLTANYPDATSWESDPDYQRDLKDPNRRGIALIVGASMREQYKPYTDAAAAQAKTAQTEAALYYDVFPERFFEKLYGGEKSVDGLIQEMGTENFYKFLDNQNKLKEGKVEGAAKLRSDNRALLKSQLEETTQAFYRSTSTDTRANRRNAEVGDYIQKKALNFYNKRVLELGDPTKITNQQLGEVRHMAENYAEMLSANAKTEADVNTNAARWGQVQTVDYEAVRTFDSAGAANIESVGLQGMTYTPANSAALDMAASMMEDAYQRVEGHSFLSAERSTIEDAVYQRRQMPLEEQLADFVDGRSIAKATTEQRAQLDALFPNGYDAFMQQAQGTMTPTGVMRNEDIAYVKAENGDTYATQVSIRNPAIPGPMRDFYYNAAAKSGDSLVWASPEIAFNGDMNQWEMFIPGLRNGSGHVYVFGRDGTKNGDFDAVSLLGESL